MPTLNDAKDKVRELSKKGLETVENDGLTMAEKKTALEGIEADIKKWTEEVQSLEFVDEKRKNFLKASGSHIEEAGGDKGENSAAYKSIGQQFVESSQYKNTIADGIKSGRFATGEVEIKTTLTEGTLGTPGGGYAIPTAVPNLLPGIVDIKFRQLTISDLFPQGTTNLPLIVYLVETALTNAAATVVEGNLKPESAISFGKVTETLHKLATFLPISDEMLEDWAQASSYIDARLMLFIKLAEEAQLLNGDGTGANLVGLLNRSGLAPVVVKDAGSPTVVNGVTGATSPSGDNDMDAIYRQITYIRTTAFLEPDAIVIDPTAWQNVLLSKATGTGNYFANGPFVDAQTPTLWSKRVVITPALAGGSALVGAFQQGGQIFRKGGITVDASNSHADFFQRNLSAVRAEERLALAIFRPGAFGQVSGL